jgi:hypothetical protein
MNAIVIAAVLGTVGCASHQPDVVGPEPRTTVQTRWLAPDVRYVVTSGEPMFVVDGHMWMWREGQWLRWHGDRWRWSRPPSALDELPSRHAP